MKGCEEKRQSMPDVSDRIVGCTPLDGVALSIAESYINILFELNVPYHPIIQGMETVPLLRNGKPRNLRTSPILWIFVMLASMLDL